ncbi:MAG: bifunctional 4-hydroxy-2-oxoglutarate aldolase/2-dehydro-3-deoxy-phosphogluconate aldolase [Clostridia bacterium]|nr:bifunctional 4-hydroxy-2-oxoglutarate aldolase/2-dehydro-3-deoxy-phosphogluconate aldolase [Clostridia bacterium]
MREQIINTIEKEKIIVIVRGVEKEKLIPLAEAMYAGGIRLLEVTYSANGKVSDEETAENIRILSQQFEGRMYIGAGTVLTEKQVELTAKAGGKFIISPDTCPEVIRKTRELGLVSMPGALTPSEMQIAHRNGADFIKIFPITSLGASYVKAVKAPLSHLKMLAVGGVDENNIAEYLKAGINGFGLGSNIIDKKKIAENDWLGITKLAKKYVSLVK